MYNINHSRSEFKLGDAIKVASCSGLDSNKEGTVVEHFDWRKEQGAYSAPSDQHIPVQYNSGAVSYMHRNRLMKLEYSADAIERARKGIFG